MTSTVGAEPAEARSPTLHLSLSPTWVAGAHVLELLSASFPGGLAGSEMRGRVAENGIGTQFQRGILASQVVA